METKPLITLLRYAAVCGNIVFVLWILFNAMDEGFRGTLPEKLSAIGLIGLLAVNSLLLLKKSTQNN
ncbi:hypothetical protein [Mucilaginibacter gotjawali]|uniref:Uncharacterized protein n=2 Tax=Mucilaginibacter gotjawali TaxID=1550579 RepID=A0A0X8X026_9SPHI|nr:hypothetical protein [Mucilaginibacter gotjawali]MBB3055422.1 hypothetical protein [Mucilaginibacter gotjawali]BAU53301.1 hypothetical protein MgSA37_01468 [Mucilaginibacter gotjawali]